MPVRGRRGSEETTATVPPLEEPSCNPVRETTAPAEQPVRASVKAVAASRTVAMRICQSTDSDN